MPIEGASPVSAMRVTGTAVVHLRPGSAAEPEQRIVGLHNEVMMRCQLCLLMRIQGCDIDIAWRLAGDDDEEEDA